MLWKLTQDTNREIPANAAVNKDTSFYIIGPELTIGRGECNLTLPNDQSVSRKHAAIKLENGVVVIKDLGSRYGTFINPDNEANPKTIPANESRKLENGDKVRFGMQWNVWNLECLNIKTIVTSLSGDQKKSLVGLLAAINGQIQNDYDPTCTHVTVDSIYLTVKFLWGLVKGLPIVTPTFWKDFNESVKSNRTLPNPKNYLPPIGEDVLNKENINLDPTQRQELFKNKQFLFSNEQSLKKLEKLVQIAGGQCGIWPSDNTVILQSNTIILYPNVVTGSIDSQNDPRFEEIKTILKENGKRMIPEHEIALAIWYGNCSTHCNVDFNVQKLLLGAPAFVERDGDILVQESQNVDTSLNVGPQVVIPSSQCDMEVSSTTDVTAKKRGAEEEDLFVIPGEKRRKIETKETTAASTSNGTALQNPPKVVISLDDIHFKIPTSKRKLEEVDETTSSESKRQTRKVNQPTADVEFVREIEPAIIQNIYSTTGWLSKSFIKMEIKDEEISAVENGNADLNGEIPNGDVTNGEKEDEKKDIKFEFKQCKVKVMPSMIVRNSGNVSVENMNGNIATNGKKNFKNFKKQVFRKPDHIINCSIRVVCDGKSTKTTNMNDSEDITDSFAASIQPSNNLIACS